MTATLGSFPVFRAFDADGAPLVGGLLYSYAAGTLTPLATYVDQAGVTTNANPVVLDSTGSANVWFGSSAYKLVLKDSVGATLWTVDNYQPDGYHQQQCGSFTQSMAVRNTFSNSEPEYFRLPG